jgi:hypothetical protein
MSVDRVEITLAETFDFDSIMRANGSTMTALDA